MVALGVESSGHRARSALQKAGVRPRRIGTQQRGDRGPRRARRQATPPHRLPYRLPVSSRPCKRPFETAPPRPPSRYAQWAEEKYMKALESPQMVSAFHDGGTLGNRPGRQWASKARTSTLAFLTDQAVTLHPPASAFSVMAGSVIPAVLVSGINSDLPGPILAQVSQNVFDSATGKYLLVPQGSRLIGIYQNASTYGQQRVEIAWQRLSSRTPRAWISRRCREPTGRLRRFHRRSEQPLPERPLAPRRS